MTDKLETLSPSAKIADLLEVFDRGRVAIVMDGAKFLGLITRSDLLAYLRLRMPKSAAAGGATGIFVGLLAIRRSASPWHALP